MPVSKSRAEHVPASERESSAEIYYKLNRNGEALDCILYGMLANTAALATNETGKTSPIRITKTAKAMFPSILELSQALHDNLMGRSEAVAESDAALSKLDGEMAREIDKKSKELTNKLMYPLGNLYWIRDDAQIRDSTNAAIDEVKTYIKEGKCALALDCLLVDFISLFNKLEKEMAKPDADWLRMISMRQQDLVGIAVKSLSKRSDALKNSEIEQERELSVFDLNSIEKIGRLEIRERLDHIVRLLNADDARASDIAEVRTSIMQPHEWILSEVLAKIKEFAENAEKGSMANAAAAKLVAKLVKTFELENS